MGTEVLDNRPARHFGMDWLRIGAFALLILYHVGMTFVPWPFELKVAPPQDWVAIPMLATNAWRLALLFVVSGYASAALLNRSPTIGAFTRQRLARLGLPLLFGMLLLNTPQPWVALVTQHGYAHGFPDFFVHDYFAFQKIDGVAMPTWMHLWFVVYLLVYTLVAAGLAALLRGRAQALADRLDRWLAGPLLLLLPIAWVFAARQFLPPGWNDTHGLVDDWSAHAVYFPAFLFGLALRRSERLLAHVAAQLPLAAVLALAAYGGVIAVERTWPGTIPLPDQWRPWFNLFRSVQCWAAIVALVGVAERFLNRDHRWRAPLAEAVFPFYLIHQTIILVVGYWLLPTPTGALTRFLILVAATASGCWLFAAVGGRIGWLRRWIGFGPAARRPVQAAPPSAAVTARASPPR